MVSLTDSKATDEYGPQRMSERIKAINSNMTPFAFFRQFLSLITDYYGGSKSKMNNAGYPTRLSYSRQHSVIICFIQTKSPHF